MDEYKGNSQSRRSWLEVASSWGSIEACPAEPEGVGCPGRLGDLQLLRFHNKILGGLVLSTAEEIVRQGYLTSPITLSNLPTIRIQPKAKVNGLLGKQKAPIFGNGRVGHIDNVGKTQILGHSFNNKSRVEWQLPKDQ